jgi:hypothetical protein
MALFNTPSPFPLPHIGERIKVRGIPFGLFRIENL